MRLLKFLSIIFLGVFLISFSSAFYPNIPSPSELLENEWFLFAVIFLIVFTFVYISLANVFTKTRKNETFPWLTEKEFHKAPVLVISICIALLTSAALIRGDFISSFLSSYLGETAGIWILAMLVVVLIVLTIPFYKFLKINFGGAAGMALAALFAAFWFALNMVDIRHLVPYYSYQLEEIFELIKMPAVLFIIIGIGILSLVINKIRS